MTPVHAINPRTIAPLCRAEERIMTDDDKLISCPACRSIQRQQREMKGLRRIQVGRD